MPSKYEEEDFSIITPVSISGRKSKVRVEQFVDPESIPSRELSQAAGNLESIFPDILAGRAIKMFVLALKKARDEGREILWLVGAHVIKCGLSLYVRSLIDKGFITAMATTGSAVVHDLELAFFGQTSEDVGKELPLGRFGMSRETADHFVKISKHAGAEDKGLGEGVGAYISNAKAPYEKYSIFSKAFQKSTPATIHVAFGTDVVHQHPSFPADLVGELTMRDFRIITRAVGNVFDRGVVVVLGAAVVLPEVFLKAVSISYNLGKKPSGVTVASFDMLHQYRVSENILTRPFQGEAESYRFTGHHEIMLPLLYSLLTFA